VPASALDPVVERAVLANGLRVLVAPDPTAPVVAVAVVYDVGFRSEPEGRTGFAHLFEHLMFQGSMNVAKLEHGRFVQGAGGVFNGHTRPDLTSYYEAMPSSSLELALWLEADRMAGLRLDDENVANQIAVVQEEIRVNVLNRPYGGFPWIDLPPVAFDTFANAHNGYGSFEDLERATVRDAEAFFHAYYAPANAVLVVAGDVTARAVFELAERHFGDITARPAPGRPDFQEPPLAAARHASREDPNAPSPAVVVGLRAPDPVGDLAGLCDAVVVAAILGDGDASRLRQRLVHAERLVTDCACYLGVFGDPFSMRDPRLFQTLLFHPGRRTAEQLLGEVRRELELLASEGPGGEELERVRTRLAAELWRSQDRVLERALAIADAELIHHRPKLATELPLLLEAVDADRVRAAAKRLADQHPAVLEVLPAPAGGATVISGAAGGHQEPAPSPALSGRSPGPDSTGGTPR
jgi:zinc protease